MPQIIYLNTTANSTSSNILSFFNVPVTEIQYGSTVTGTGIPAGTYVAAFSTNTITLSEIVTVTAGTQIIITSNSGAVLRTNSDYKIKVPSNGRIILDTGTNVGQVFITGDLNVQGNTTTINTTNMNIEDNIIVLNKGELSFQVSEGTSGIEIDRGTATEGNAQLLWDESMSWVDPWTETTRFGLFVFKTKQNNRINGIRTNSIDTDGNKLALISKGLGVVTVEGTTDYERQILNYDSVLQAYDDDLIPNIRAVTDKIAYEIINSPSDKIKRDDTEVKVYDNNITNRITYYNAIGSTTVSVFHNLTTNAELNVKVGSEITISGSTITALNGKWTVSAASPGSQTFNMVIATPISLSNQINTASSVLVNDSKSNVKVIIDSQKVAEFQDNHIDFYDLRFQQSTIESLKSGDDLLLVAPGTGSVQIQDNLKIMFANIPENLGGGGGVPTATANAVKIYTNTEGAGDTGIYFVNPTLAVNTGDYRRDELISKKKAIAFSILM